MFLIFRSRPDHTTVLMVMVAQTAVGRETWDLTRMAAAALAAHGDCPLRL